MRVRVRVRIVCFYMQHAHMWAMHGTHSCDSEVQFPMLAGMLPVR